MKILLSVILLSVFFIPNISNACDFTSNGNCGYLRNPAKLEDASVGSLKETRTLDYSGWHRCPNGTASGGSCGSRSLTTGNNRCQSHSVQVGFDFELFKLSDAHPGLKFKTGYSTSWSVCNSRSESIRCEPNEGYQGRVEVRMEIRDGVKRFTNEEIKLYRPATRGRCSWGARWRAVRGNWKGQCINGKVSGTKSGEWPSTRFSQCIYRRI